MRRIPLSRRSHITGFQTLTVSGLTEHESALERDFVALTTFRDAAARIISQPITLSFREGPTARRYTPDFLVHWGERARRERPGRVGGAGAADCADRRRTGRLGDAGGLMGGRRPSPPCERSRGRS